MYLTINPSIILQGTLTFVAAIACSDAIKEVIAAARPRTPWESAILKVSVALVIITIILIVIHCLPLSYNTYDHASLPSEDYTNRKRSRTVALSPRM